MEKYSLIINRDKINYFECNIFSQYQYVSHYCGLSEYKALQQYYNNEIIFNLW